MKSFDTKPHCHAFEEEILCGYLNRWIDEGLCYDIRMIANGFILPSALPALAIDRPKAKKACENCRYRIENDKKEM